MLDICLLGTGGMMPLPYRWLTALMARYNGKSILIDCGEGTQIALKEKGWSPNPIDVICFTHFHADHISGLPGMLLTMGNAERHDPLLLIGPKGLTRTVNALRTIAPAPSITYGASLGKTPAASVIAILVFSSILGFCSTLCEEIKLIKYIPPINKGIKSVAAQNAGFFNCRIISNLATFNVALRIFVLPIDIYKNLIQRFILKFLFNFANLPICSRLTIF